MILCDEGRRVSRRLGERLQRCVLKKVPLEDADVDHGMRNKIAGKNKIDKAQVRDIRQSLVEAFTRGPWITIMIYKSIFVTSQSEIL